MLPSSASSPSDLAKVNRRGKPGIPKRLKDPSLHPAMIVARLAAMKVLVSLVAFLLPVAAFGQQEKRFGIVIHGGGISDTKPSESTPEREKPFREMMAKALDAGYAVLEKGGSSLDAVSAAVVILEDSPLFNAGTGAVLNREGFCELDASIMDGKTRKAGAVAGVQRIKNPVLLARDVMDKSRHVMLIGAGAEKFAESLGHKLISNEALQTEERRQELRKALAEEEAKKSSQTKSPERHLGTVGAVALDRQGNLAAATSTGGIALKKYGRVGDSPIIGAGTFAYNPTCAVSCTGTGEYFIRVGVAREVSTLMAYKNLTLSQSVASAIEQVGELGGDGGLIAIDHDGNVAWNWNIDGLFRGSHVSGQASLIELFGEKR